MIYRNPKLNLLLVINTNNNFNNCPDNYVTIWYRAVELLLGEYSNSLIMSTVFVCFFFGGGDYLIFSFLKINFNCNSFLIAIFYDFFLGLKIILIAFVFVFIRANLPRFRFDQLMFIGWKIFLPITLGSVLFYSCLLLILGCLEVVQFPRVGSVYNFISFLSIRF